MMRPPCCEKLGIKKGPWTPEEDIILVSYIQEHGPGNWRSVPINTGLLRCSKSCRLRWTNYLRPGIKRGNFNTHEEGIIIQLQSLLGNKWAAIASYLPQRTDNDIKNYWNTYLKKKLNKSQLCMDTQMAVDHSSACLHFMSRGIYTTREGDPRRNQFFGAKISENRSGYASSSENISRLLQGWMGTNPMQANDHPQFNGNQEKLNLGNPTEHNDGDELQCILSFDHNMDLMGCDKSVSSDSSQKGSERSGLSDQEKVHLVQEKKLKTVGDPPFSVLERWLLDETAGQGEEIMEMVSLF